MLVMVNTFPLNLCGLKTLSNFNAPNSCRETFPQALKLQQDTPILFGIFSNQLPEDLPYTHFLLGIGVASKVGKV